MSFPVQTPRSASLTPGRGVRVLSTPCDPAGYVGNSAIQYQMNLGAIDAIGGVCLAAMDGGFGGALYYSAIHGAVGSDSVNPNSFGATPFQASRPAFPNPEVDGYFGGYGPTTNTLQNGYVNTEKRQRLPSDAQGGTNNGTVWLPLQGRNKLNFSLWVASTVPTDIMKIELFQDLNPLDKVAGYFGAGAGPGDLENAILVNQWVAQSAQVNSPLPNLVTSGPYEIPAGCNLYIIFKNLGGTATNKAVGSVWFS